jgi:hypothetical protein
MRMGVYPKFVLPRLIDLTELGTEYLPGPRIMTFA